MPSGRPARVTVLMPVYNAAEFLRAAVDSVLRQTMAELELLIVDDGSTDDSGGIADSYAAADRRVRVVHHEHHGLVASLNFGLDTIQSELIARADADDINELERLARQIAFLDANPEVGVCGTGIVVFPPEQVWTLPQTDDALRATLLFGVPFYHSTVVMRRDWIARSGQRYDADFAHAEDYDFWERAARLTRFANLAAPLVRYRHHAAQVSVVHHDDQRAQARRVRRRVLTALGVAASEEQLRLHEDLIDAGYGRDSGRLAAAGEWLETLSRASRLSAYFPEPAYTEILAARWYRCCVTAVLHGQPVVVFSQTSLASARGWRWLYVLRLRILRLLGGGVGRQTARLWNLWRRRDR